MGFLPKNTNEVKLILTPYGKTKFLSKGFKDTFRYFSFSDDDLRSADLFGTNRERAQSRARQRDALTWSRFACLGRQRHATPPGYIRAGARSDNPGAHGRRTQHAELKSRRVLFADE